VLVHTEAVKAAVQELLVLMQLLTQVQVVVEAEMPLQIQTP
jgi:hypothetical protein